MSASVRRYSEACRALAEAKRIDEVKDIADKALALKIYARQANNRALELDAAEIRIRAERRLGEMLAEETIAGRIGVGRPQKNGSDLEPFSGLTLEKLGVDKKLSSRAQRLAAEPAARFEEMIAGWRASAERESARVTTGLLHDTSKREARALREASLGARIVALPERRYGVIYADPEWRFEPWSRESGMDRAPENHYPTSDTGAICARDVAAIAADDCALFMWATVPMLPDALRVMGAWGFCYRSQIVWIKDRVGTGYWFRNKHEILLVGARGDIPAPAPGTQWPSAIEAPVGAHSAKPDVFADLIEAYFPTLPKIELNRRGPPRPGWDAWGNEAETREDAA